MVGEVEEMLEIFLSILFFGAIVAIALTVLYLTLGVGAVIVGGIITLIHTIIQRVRGSSS